MLRRRLIRDVSKVRLRTVFVIGMLAGFIVSPLWPEAWNGSATPLIEYLIVSGLIGCCYGIVLRSAHRSGAAVGFQISIAHWIVAGLLIGIVSKLAPGWSGYSFFMAAQGPLGFGQFAVGHFLYGIIVGVLFDRCAIRLEYPRPLNEPPNTLHYFGPR